MKDQGLDLYYFMELEEYVIKGVPLILEGRITAPAKVYETLRESNDYMSDYVGDEAGVVKEIRFDKISKM